MDLPAIAEQAGRAVRLAMEDPHGAEALATEALRWAIDADLAEAEATALRALGLAARARHDIPAAITQLRAAVEVAEGRCDPNVAAEARVGLAGAFAFAGEIDTALKTLDEARATGATVVMVASQRVAILAMVGRYEEALRAYRPLIPAIRRLGNKLLEGRALNNRGLLHTYTGRFARAEADLARAEKLMVAAGSLTEAAEFCHNRGFAAARKGDLPAALALFDAADRRCREMGVQSGVRGLDRAGALLAAGLVQEARSRANEALDVLRDGGNIQDLAEGLVLLADIALLAGDSQASRSAAEEAMTLFDSEQRAGWHALACAAVARAGLALGDRQVALAVSASDAASRLDAMGLVDRAAMAHGVAGRLWLSAGAPDPGLAELAQAGAGRYRGTAAQRLAAWEAEAERRLAGDDRRGAMAAIRCALAVVDDQQASLGATELRAHVAVHARDAATLGLRLAVETGRAGSIWQWMERHRANSLRTWPARPPGDDILGAQLAELRALGGDIAQCATTGGDPRELVVRQSNLERRIRERAWQAAATGRSRPGRPAPVADLGDALGKEALVELAEIDGYLHAVVIADGRCRHRRLATSDEVRREVAHLRFALRRLAYAKADGSLGAGGQAQLEKAADRLDHLLLAPIAWMIGSSPVVMVPTGELHALPWATLPTLAGRAVSVAPSARLWLDAATAAADGPHVGGPARGAVIVVAGSGLAGADHEAATVASLYPSARVLSGAHAQVAAVAAGLQGADLAHVAAHATYRADNALWSSLEMADGALTVYELEQLHPPPRMVVLSACQSGLSTVRPGDELMGLVAALLTIGTEAVVASVVPVDDRTSETVMVELHRRLISGDRPAIALAGTQAAIGDPVSVSYVCFGGG